MSNLHMIPIAICSYGLASFFMYKYSQLKLANEEIKEVKNKREYLYNKHQEIAQDYDKLILK